MTSIAVIPARGGSKRVPRKNIRSFEGRPVICHTIELLKENTNIKCIYVSTDDEEIEKISSKAGARIIRRPSSISNDEATTLEVMSHAVKMLAHTELKQHKNLFCVYPINPFLNHNHLEKALTLINTNKFDYVFTAKQFQSPIQRALELNHLGFATMIDKDNAQTRTQDLKKRYHDAGMFYLANSAVWESRTPIFDGRSSFVEIGKYESVDVDDEEDWNMLERLAILRDRFRN